MPEDVATAPGSADVGQVDTTSLDAGQGEDTSPESTGQAASTETDTFSSLDPATLPDNLKPIYNQMLKDYRTKTEEVADLRKNAGTWKERADAFDALMSNDSFTKLLENLDKPETPATPDTLTGEDLLTQIIADPKKLNELIREEAKKLVDPIAHDIYDERAAKEYQALTEKYPDLPQYEAAMVEEIEKSDYKLSPEQAYMLVTYNKVKQAGINEGIKAAQKRDSTAQPTTSAPVSSNDSYASVRDAIAAAFRSAKS